MKTREQVIAILVDMLSHMRTEEAETPMFASGIADDNTLYSTKRMLQEIEADSELGKQLLKAFQNMHWLF